MIITEINLGDLTTALERSTALYAALPKIVANLERACEKLVDATWTYDDDAAELCISSATTPGVAYKVDFLSCTCIAGRRSLACWHGYARDLISFAVSIGYERSMPAGGVLSMDDAAYEALLAETDSWFS
jgi:hypothetical protein